MLKLAIKAISEKCDMLIYKIPLSYTYDKW